MPGQTQNLNGRDRALRAAERLRGTRAGVAVLEQQSDAATDTFAEPTLMAHFGEVPEAMLEQLAA